MSKHESENLNPLDTQTLLYVLVVATLWECASQSPGSVAELDFDLSCSISLPAERTRPYNTAAADTFTQSCIKLSHGSQELKGKQHCERVRKVSETV